MFSAILLLTAAFLSSCTVLIYRTGWRPKIPPVISIFMPWYDDAIRFGLNPIGFLQQGSIRNGSIYQMRLAGRNVVVTSDVDGILRVMRDQPKTLHLMNRQFLNTLGGVKGHVPLEFLDRLSNCAAKTFANKGVPELSPNLNDHIFQSIQAYAQTPPEGRIPLRRFVGKTLYDAASFSVWGPHFPLESYEDFYIIDDKISLTLGPSIFVPRAVAKARNNLHATLATYVQDCWDETYGVIGTPEGVSDMVRIMRECSPDVSPNDAAGVFLTFVIGLHSNTHRIIIWLLLHLQKDQTALLRLRDEIDHAVDVEFGDLTALLAAPPHKLSLALPFLESAIFETLRLWYAAMTIRDTLEKTELPSSGPGVVLTAQPGDMVIGNSYAINMSDEHFEDASTFRADRFVGCSDEEGRPKGRPLGSFGGGIHICKGRDFALYQIKVFMVLCMQFLDLTFETESGNTIGSSPLKADMKRSIPSFVMYPSEEVYVRMKGRDPGIVVSEKNL